MDYISSPELGFLKNISARVGRKAKLVYSFLDKNLLDHSINQTYGSLSRNLTFIKSVASGIMVPKDYIWPVTNDNYLLPSTSIVTDAHKAGLEIYASDFANDRIIPYNYSYDPLAEYLNFINDGGFSVDGVLSEHPITASEAIGKLLSFALVHVKDPATLLLSIPTFSANELRPLFSYGQYFGFSRLLSKRHNITILHWNLSSNASC